MKIKSMTASFGKLDNDVLVLKDGLNIIQAPNEYGKTTWSAFIRAMLFGINTSERDKAGFLSDKTKYRPWNGKNMEGTMDISHNGSNITIQRTSLASSPMKKFSAYYTDILRPVEGLSADNAGEILTGATDKVFDRTAYIRQSGISVSGDPNLEKRIAGLISSGEEQTSYSEADIRLRARQRKIRHNKTGLLPRLEEERANLNAVLEKMNDISDKIADTQLERERSKERSARYLSDLELYRQLDQNDLASRAYSAKRRAVEAGQRASELREKLTKNGLVINQNDVSNIANLYAQNAADEIAVSRSSEEKVTAQNLFNRAQIDKESSIFNGMSSVAASERASEAERAQETKTALDRKVSSFGHKFLLIAAILLIGLAGYLAWNGSFLYAVIPAAAAIALIITFCIPRSKRKKATAVWREKLSPYGAKNAEEMRQKSNEYTAFCRRLEECEHNFKSVTREYDELSQNAKGSYDALFSAVNTFFPEIRNSADIAPALTALSEPLRALPQAELEQARALSEVNAILSATNGILPDKLPEYIPRPSRSREDVQTGYARASERIADLNNTEALLKGQLMELGDPIETTARIAELDRKIAEAKEEYDTLSFAIETLSAVHTELQTKFSPILNDAACEIFTHLTDGRYERLVFDKNFSALAKTDGDSLSRDILSLSTGTTDQIYLSLRLAMVELLLSKGEPCPIILDDVLSSFDDIRAKKALEYLYGMSLERQIILFTCHSREALFIGDKPGVNVIKA